MQSSDEVLECHMVAGGFDYLVKVRVRDMNAYRRFLGENLAQVRGVMQTHTYVVMEEVKAVPFAASLEQECNGPLATTTYQRPNVAVKLDLPITLK